MGFYRVSSQPFNCVKNIYLTMCISVASCERSFSKLKPVKSYLRSTMSQIRLTSLAILSIERDITNVMNFDTIINDFAALKIKKSYLNKCSIK